MAGTVLGIVSPGAMGSALGRAWQAAGARVVATTRGRSARTAALARGLDLLDDLHGVVAAADVVLSVCPPSQAPDVAEALADAAKHTGHRPLVVDLNAVAPTTMGHVAQTLAAASLDVVDGSISGGPPTGRGRPTRVYLSGPRAAEIAGLQAPGIALEVVSARIGDASAVKMCTASVYKGFAGLLTQALRTAEANGVTDLVVADLQGSFGSRVEDAAVNLALAASKADRYPAEMREIAATQHGAGLAGDLFEAMARLFEAVDQTALAQHTPEEAAHLSDLHDVLAQLSTRRAAAG